MINVRGGRRTGQRRSPEQYPENKCVAPLRRIRGPERPSGASLLLRWPWHSFAELRVRQARTKFCDKSGSMGNNNVDHTYDALVGSLELEAKSLARYWLRDMPDPSWDEPSEFGQLVTPSTRRWSTKIHSMPGFRVLQGHRFLHSEFNGSQAQARSRITLATESTCSLVVRGAINTTDINTREVQNRP